jgi:UDP-N-acetylmuramyl pentapeptide synthase
VGDLSKSTALAAERAGMKKDAIHWFSKSLEAVSLLQEMITENTIVLVKGSQGMRMEKIVKEIMSEPMRAVDLLCRQNAGWQKKL